MCLFPVFHDSEWFVHPLPRYLVLTGSEIINSFVQAKEADSDIIDAVIRCLCQLDANVQSGGVPVRWRHFIETDFAVNLLYACDVGMFVLNILLHL